jgi:sulfite exporter TauE/SafE
LTYLLLHIGMSDMSGLNAGVSFGSIFLLGLMTSPHCLFMCGGIMLGTACSDNNKEFSKASLAYNLGRIFSYTVIGAIFGTLGTVITYSMSVKSMVFTLVGLLVVLIGLNMWGLLPFLHVLAPQQATACRLPGTARKRFHGRPMIIGMLTGLMPCGSLYAMWLHAISGGSAAYGAVIMLCFALGTAPMMFLFGSLGSLFPRRWNKYFLKISAVLVCSMGLKMLINGLKMLH